MPSRGGRIHAADFPFAFIHALQRGDILVKPVYENDMMKDGTVRQLSQITMRYQPFIFQRNRKNTVETTFRTQQISQCPIPAIAFGNQRISRQIQGNGLITLHSECVRHAAIGITHKLAD